MEPKVANIRRQVSLYRWHRPVIYATATYDMKLHPLEKFRFYIVVFSSKLGSYIKPIMSMQDTQLCAQLRPKMRNYSCNNIGHDGKLQGKIPLGRSKKETLVRVLDATASTREVC